MKEKQSRASNSLNIVSSDIISAIKLSELIDRKLAAKHTMSPNIIKKHSMEPIDVVEKSHANIKLANLYRRYRATYLLGLQDAISIIKRGKDKEDCVNLLLSVVKDIGTIEKLGKRKCAESSD